MTSEEEDVNVFNVFLILVVALLVCKVLLFCSVRRGRESEVFAKSYCTDYLSGKYNVYENNSLYYGHYCYVNDTVYEMSVNKGFINLTEANRDLTCGWGVTCA